MVMKSRRFPDYNSNTIKNKSIGDSPPFRYYYSHFELCFAGGENDTLALKSSLSLLNHLAGKMVP